MKKTYKISFIALLGVIGIIGVSIYSIQNNEDDSYVNSIKEIHKQHLNSHPFIESLKLSKKERKKLGIPPNKYNEEQWVFTMNPELGRPTPIKVLELQKELLAKRANLASRAPGDKADNMWVERGPDNVGGRTRAVMFDPNDPTNETAFAGGVSGGLWKNTNISNPNSEWFYVGITENLAVSSIMFDPNDPNIFYVGTGESFPGGSDSMTSGSGLWKSEDAGNTWTNIFGGNTGDSYFVSASNITANSPVSVVGDYQSFPTTNFGPEITSTITSDFVLANDATGVPTEACTSFGPDATGRIALIRRGECNFVVKVKNAQDAGALGVIMMNNVSGEPVPMGGEDVTITIPSVMISKEDGDTIEAAMASGTVNGSLNPTTGDITGTIVPGVQYINDVQVKDNGGVSEIYVAVGSAGYVTSNAITYVGGDSYGFYKSVDGGTNWIELDLPLTTNGNKHEPMDIEIGADGAIWVSTTNSRLFNDGGGKVFKSTDGSTFTEAYAVSDGGRTQIAVSATNAGTIYVLSNLNTGGVSIKRTIITTIPGFFPELVTTNLTPPTDPSSYVDSADFTNGQGWYNLAIDVDTQNDNIVYIGGINIFKSTNQGDAWSKISYGYISNGSSDVHPDQHIAAFGHGDSSKMLFGNDGGVYYSNDGGATISARNNGYNTGQFYTLAVAPTTAFTGDYFAGGLQDNANQLFENANPTGADSSYDPFNGGDGAYTFFDQDGTDQYFIGNYVYNNSISLYDFASSTARTINDEDASNGYFINPQALDSNLDILYSNYSADGNSIVKRYSGIKPAATLTKTDLTNVDELTASPTALKVSPHTTMSSTLILGTRLGDVVLVENADGATPTWTNLDGNLLVGSVSDIEFGQSENDIFVTMHNYGVNNVWFTSDQGANWQAKDGNLPDLPVKAILQNPLNLEEVIIGTELGVWYTNNFSSANPTWNTSFNGMSNVKVLDLDLRNDNMVFAATLGRGVFSGQFTATSLSIEDNIFSSSNLRIYPTVSNGEISIVSKDYIEKTILNVYSITGKRVYSDNLDLSKTKTTLDLTGLQSGLYLMKFSKDNIETTHKILIK